MKTTRVAVLRGGPSEEYAISMITGAAVLEALRSAGYPAKDVSITRSGEWLDEGIVRSPDQVLDATDVVFLALHGSYGEDGSIQRVLERKHIPFTGSRAFASGMALNKDLTKNYLKQFNVRMPKHFKVTRDGTADPFRTAESVQQLFGPKYVIKPIGSGSSLGTVMVDNATQLALALTNALTEYDQVMIEEQIVGTEATVAVLEGYRDEPLYVFPPIEIIPPTASKFFDYKVKYDGSTQELCPGRFSPAVRRELQEISTLVHREMGLQQYSRSDFMIRDGEVYFLEVNTLPGLTPQSLMPKAFTAMGGSYVDLVTHLVESARV